jgi:hypothetical protein
VKDPASGSAAWQTARQKASTSANCPNSGITGRPAVSRLRPASLRLPLLEQVGQHPGVLDGNRFVGIGHKKIRGHAPGRALDAALDDETAETETPVGRGLTGHDHGRALKIEQILVEGLDGKADGTEHADRHEADKHHSLLSCFHV